MTDPKLTTREDPRLDEVTAREADKARTKRVHEHLIKWAEQNSAFCDGRVGEVLKEYKKGHLRPDAFKRAIKILKDPGKRDDNGYKSLIDHLLPDNGRRLVQGNYLDFGANFPTIADAYESSDKDIRDLAENFIEQKDLQGEKRFLQRLKSLKQGKVTPDQIKKQTEAEVALAKIKGRETPRKTIKGSESGKGILAGSQSDRTAEIMAQQVDLGILPEPPSELRERLPETTRRLTAYLSESTRRLDVVRGTLKESQALTSSKEALRAKLKAEPDFGPTTLERLVEDYELLKRTANVVESTSGNSELLEALEAFDGKRRAYFEKSDSVVLASGENPHAVFLKAKESEAVRSLLMKAAQKNIDEVMETMLELEVQRAVEEVIFEAVDNGTKLTDDSYQKAISKIRTKYKIDSAKIDDVELLKKLKANAEKFISHERENVETRKEYLKSSAEMKRYQALCISRKNDMEYVEGLSGIKLMESRDGMDIYPRIGMELTYQDYETRTLTERSEVDESDPDFVAKTSEIKLDADGRAKKQTKTARVVAVEYVSQSYEKGEEAEAAFQEMTRWHPENQHPGRLKIILEIDGKLVPHSKKEFLGWVATFEAHENMKSMNEVEERVEQATGVRMKIGKGTKFLQESHAQEPEGPPQYRIIEVADVLNGKVKLQSPVKYSAREELYMSNSLRADHVHRELTFGQLYSLIIRRNLVPLDQDLADTALQGISGTPRQFTYHHGWDSDQTETRTLRRDGTLGDVEDHYGEAALFGGQKLTQDQKRAFRGYPTFREDFYADDPNTGKRRRFVKDHNPAIAHMHDKHKFDASPAEGAVGGKQVAESDAEASAAEAAQSDSHGGGHGKGDSHGGGHEGHGKGDWPALKACDLHVEGETHTHRMGFLKSLWNNTHVLATDDIFGLAKSAYEHYERRWHRRSKEKFSIVGKGLPSSYGTEMNRIKQSAEDEEVHQNTEAMEHWGIWQIQEALHHPGNKDQLKACFEVLAKKGHIRWDDVEMWEALNEHLPNSKQIPIPPHHNAQFKDARTGKTGLDYLESAIDYIWGESTYQEWYEGNNHVYDDKLKHYSAQGKQLEGDPKHNKSIDGELTLLLEKHKRGEYVDPHQYEGLLWFLIDAGKGSAESKVYFMVEGVAVKNPVNGETILSWERLGSINGEYLNRFPMMDFLCRRDVPRPDGKPMSWTVQDFRRWCEDWDADVPPGKENRPNAKVTRFMWEHILTDEKTITRNNKGIRKAEEMDHDDAHIIIPLTDEGTVENACMSASGGKRYFTYEGYANAYPGYNQYMKTLARIGDKAKLRHAVRSFVRFNAIMDNRFRKDNSSYGRLGPSYWEKPSVVDTRITGWHKKQLETLIEEIAHAYAGTPEGAELLQIVRTIHIKTRSTTDPEQKKIQNDVQQALENFGGVFDKVIATDNGAKLVETINRFNLSGMEEITPEERRRRYAMMGEQSELEKIYRTKDDGGEADV